MSDLYAIAQQTSPGVASDGTFVAVRATRDGIPFSATWRQALVLEGRCFQMTVGALADGAVTGLIRGGGVGGVTDLDEPEFGVSVANGLALIPFEIDISVSVDLDANDEVAEAVVIADTAAAFVGDGTTVAMTPINCISDGPASAATAFSEGSAAITDPTCSMILAHELIREMGVTDTSGMDPIILHLHYEPEVPPILKGPAAFYGYWGGTSRTDGAACVIWAEVPEGRFTL